MSKHTPGPWTIDEKPTEIRIVANQKVVAEVNVYAFGCGANARLMAAAPELLDALKRLREWHRMEYLSNADIDAIADAAISKAEGDR